MTWKSSPDPEVDPDATSESLRIGHYRLLRRIGRGGFGTVYEAWDERLGRAVAVKVLAQRDSTTAIALLAEARVAAGLEHPAFVRVIDVVEADGQAALIMELIRGRTLAAHLSETVVMTTQAMRWLHEIAVAMAEAHRLGRFHGDLKPANLMIDGSNRIRILDFGLARERAITPMSEIAAEQPGAGTLAYMAPEQLLGAAGSTATDIYAIGLLLGDMLTRQRPYAPHQGGELAQSILHGADPPHPLQPSTASAICDLYRDLTARDAALRADSLAAISDRIADIQRQLAESADSPGAASRHGFLRRRIALLALAVMAVASITFSLWQSAPISRTSPLQRLNQAEQDLYNVEQPGNLARAIRDLESVLAEHPHHAAAAANLALAYCFEYAGSGRDASLLQRAAAAADIAIQQEDQLARAHAAKGWVLEFQGRLDEARASYERARLLDPGDRYALLGQSRVQSRLGDDAAGKRTLDVAIRLYPADRLFVDALGTWYFRGKQYAEAEAAFRRAIALQPDSVSSYANLNAVLLHENRLDEALAVLQQGLRIRPDGKLYTNLGNVLFRMGRYPESATAFEHAVAPEFGSPNDYRRWANLADALRFVPGREADAAQAYRITLGQLTPLLAHTPDDVLLLSRAALFRAKLGHCTEALADVTRIRKNLTNDADAWFRIANVSELCHQRDQALEELVTAVDLGYPLHLAVNEPDLRELRRDRRFQERVMGSPRPSPIMD